MTLDPAVALLVLAAAVMHASWNALVKSAADKVVMQALVMLVSGVPALVLLPFLPLPAPESWPFLVTSLLVHGIYYVTLANAYRLGDLSQVYPIARGASPIMIALGAWAFAGEALRPLELVGVGVVSLGIISLATPGRVARDGETRAIGFALATSVTIALYPRRGRARAGSRRHVARCSPRRPLLLVTPGCAAPHRRELRRSSAGIVGGLIAGPATNRICDGACADRPVSARETSVILRLSSGCCWVSRSPPPDRRRSGGDRSVVRIVRESSGLSEFE
jgi:uncharacterized membrane protein